ncbi:MAG TPA: hypothetical protein P5121_32260 [Caldilineaceae bacterium]|nr:hypothetical protein [Caldilineaceae bacterium]
MTTNGKRVPLILFWVGLLFALAFTSIGTQSLMQNLRTLTIEENNATIWADGGFLWITWGFSVTLGSLVAAIGAFLYVKTKAVFSWLTAIGVLGAVFAMLMVWSRFYNATLFGIGGTLILVAFFAIVWVWMKKYAALDMPEKIAGSFKLIGYLFWINTSWFLCGETARMHLKAFEGKSPPVPIEIMVFLVLGWLFVLIGEYSEMRVAKTSSETAMQESSLQRSDSGFCRPVIRTGNP